MEIFKEIPKLDSPSTLTIGMFDGVHLGHRSVLDHLTSLAKKSGHKSTVISFIKHPVQFFNPSAPLQYISTLDHRIYLLEKAGIDNLILLPFDERIANLTAEEFFTSVSQRAPIKALILGHDAKVGKDRLGTKNALMPAAKKLGFSVGFLPAFEIDGAPVSSTRVREAIITDDLHLASRLLGRLYSIYGPRISGKGFGHKIGFPTVNIEVDDLALPKLGVWRVLANGCEAIANLGHAPTLHKDRNIVLEVHFLEKGAPADYVDVIFQKYIREEKIFNTPEELKKQIAEDIASS